jgi:hypothetical protein
MCKRGFWVLIAFCLCPVVLMGHDVSRSESTIAIDGSAVRVRFAIDLLALGVDGNRDERVSYEELDARIEEVFAVIKRHYHLAAPDAPARVTMAEQRIADDHLLHAALVYTFANPVRELRVESTLDTVTAPDHVHQVRADIDGESYQTLLTPANRSVTFLAGGVTIGRIAVVLAALGGFGALVGVRRLRKTGHESTKSKTPRKHENTKKT